MAPLAREIGCQHAHNTNRIHCFGLIDHSVDLYLKVRILDSEKYHHADGLLHNRVNVFFDPAVPRNLGYLCTVLKGITVAPAFNPSR